MNAEQIMFLSLQNELSDIIDAWGGNYPGMELPHNTHCSAFIKLTDNNEDLFVAQVCGALSQICMHFSQNTWGSLNSLMRTYKLYDMPFTLDGVATRCCCRRHSASNYSFSATVPAVRSSFPSYPATLFSGDDFYVLSSGLIVQETTIGTPLRMLRAIHAARLLPGLAERLHSAGGRAGVDPQHGGQPPCRHRPGLG